MACLDHQRQGGRSQVMGGQSNLGYACIAPGQQDVQILPHRHPHESQKIKYDDGDFIEKFDPQAQIATEAEN
jgi:hypothetical protein